MATRTLTLNYPDEVAPLLVSALKAQYGQIYEVATGVHRDRTDDEAIFAFEEEIRGRLRDIVLNYQRAEATKAVEAALINPEFS